MLPEPDDPLIAGLREPVLSDPFLEEPGCARSVARARAVVEGDASTTNLPRQLGEYQLTAELGRGGMGTVYKALHTKLGRVVALKVLTRGRAQDPPPSPASNAKCRPSASWTIAISCGHTTPVKSTARRSWSWNTSKVSTWPRSSGVWEPIDPKDACELARQTAVGLQTVHEHGLVHRDIKPSNLMLTADGRDQDSRLGPGPVLRGDCTDFRAGAGRRRNDRHGPGDGHGRLHGPGAGVGQPRGWTSARTFTVSAARSTSCSPAVPRSAAPGIARRSTR